jgi:hypothetical protein
MEKEQEIPQHVLDYYKSTNDSVLNPTIVRTRNVTKLGLDTLIEKNGLEWSTSIFDEVYYYMEGLIQYGKTPVWFYFKKIDNDSTYKLYILTNKDQNLTMLLNGLNKYFTIDRL